MISPENRKSESPEDFMIEINLTPFPKLVTDRLVLRELRMEDAEEIYLLRSDESVNALIDRATATSIEDAYSFINKILSAQNNNESIMWVIALKDDPKLIGTICCWNIVKEKDEAEVGYELLPPYHGKGIMHEALKKVIAYGFDILKLKKIVAEPKNINLNSIKLLEKCGFVKVDITDYGYLIYHLNSSH